MIDDVNNLILGGEAILAEADQESVELWNRLVDWVKLANLTFQNQLNFQQMFLQDRPSEAERYDAGWSRLKWTLQNRLANLNKIKAELI